MVSARGEVSHVSTINPFPFFFVSFRQRSFPVRVGDGAPGIKSFGSKTSTNFATDSLHKKCGHTAHTTTATTTTTTTCPLFCATPSFPFGGCGCCCQCSSSRVPPVPHIAVAKKQCLKELFPLSLAQPTLACYFFISMTFLHFTHLLLLHLLFGSGSVPCSSFLVRFSSSWPGQRERNR